MADDATTQEAPTRRDALRYGGTLIAGGLLAGCSGQTESDDGGSEGGGDGSNRLPMIGPKYDTTSVLCDERDSECQFADPERVLGRGRRLLDRQVQEILEDGFLCALSTGLTPLGGSHPDTPAEPRPFDHQRPGGI